MSNIANSLFNQKPANLPLEKYNQTINLISCSRCGKSHEELEFKKILNANDQFDYFSICPETNQPILLNIEKR